MSQELVQRRAAMGKRERGTGEEGFLWDIGRRRRRNGGALAKKLQEGERRALNWDDRSNPGSCVRRRGDMT
jgi:hypothetical protein